MTEPISALSATTRCSCDYDGVRLCHSLPVERCRLLADPTTVIVTDGSPEAEAEVMRTRVQASRALDQIHAKTED